MQNPIHKFRQNSIVFEKPGTLPANLKILTSSNYPTVQYFNAETPLTFPTNVYMSTKGCVGFLNFD